MNKEFLKAALDELVSNMNTAMALAISGEPLLANDHLILADYAIHRLHTHLGYEHPKLILAVNVTYD